MQVNMVQENNIPHSEFYKFMEIFWFIHHYITCFTYVASPQQWYKVTWDHISYLYFSI